MSHWIDFYFPETKIEIEEKYFFGLLTKSKDWILKISESERERFLKDTFGNRLFPIGGHYIPIIINKSTIHYCVQFLY